MQRKERSTPQVSSAQGILPEKINRAAIWEKPASTVKEGRQRYRRRSELADEQVEVPKSKAASGSEKDSGQGLAC